MVIKKDCLKFPSLLIKGYKEFLCSDFNRDKDHYAALANEGQRPKILVVACCDSRTAPETIFNTAPGEIFVIRNIANLIPPYQPDKQYHGTSAALEFGVQVLNVEHIVVLGHAQCGGISAVLKEGGYPGSSNDFMEGWMRLLALAVSSLDSFEQLNMDEKQRSLEYLSIEYSLANLRTFPWIKEKEQAKKLSLHGVWFDILTGELLILDPKTNRFNRCIHKL